MRVIVFRVLVCLILAGGPFGLACAQSSAQGLPRLLAQSDCYGGAFASYDKWMGYLKEKNSWYASLAIRWKFPREEFDFYKRQLDCKAIKYQSDGHVVLGWIVQPKTRAPGARLPLIVYNRGGNRALGALTFADLFAHVFPLAEHGYVVTASQYRGVIPVPDEETSPDEFGGADVHDVTQLMRITVALPQVDPSNVYMIGQSRGSIMTFRALLDSPIPVRAVAIYSGVYDLHDLLRFRPEFGGLFSELIPGYAQHRTQELDKRSVNRWAAQLPARTGVLVIHGEDDERAPLGSARTFDALMTKLGRPHKAIFYPGESHFLDGHTDEIHAETLAWFRRYRYRPTPLATPARAAMPDPATL
jgi:dipeptidyl aminopeptidase/acylaminoacyl peptidase